MSLCWTLAAIASHPQVREELEAEVDRVLGGAPVTEQSLADLRYTQMVVEESLRLYPPNAEAHNNLGVAFQRVGRLDDAIREHWEALRLVPDYAEAYNNLGIVAEQQGRMEEAIRFYTTALELQAQRQNTAQTHHNMGSVLQKLGRYDEAIVEIRQALRIDPNYADAHDNLASALMRLS